MAYESTCGSINHDATESYRSRPRHSNTDSGISSSQKRQSTSDHMRRFLDDTIKNSKGVSNTVKNISDQRINLNTDPITCYAEKFLDLATTWPKKYIFCYVFLF